ncbi:FAD-binding oxidoreductase [Methylobacterium nodulans]|uniref:FAD-binding oxidoreductase n=1 Tax=Methylobacterium nodulans TaxID=114616 RepID=UPI0018DB45CD|nr:FAD-binding oxidoreductase [Methylobacterium nodulans]
MECLTASDVENAVRIASDYNAHVSVMGGGHDWTARSVCRNGITLDLRSLNKTRVNRERATLSIEGGAIVQNVLDCLPDDMAFVAGVHSQVGVSGLTLGGGYGKLNSRFGLAADTLQRAEVVLADGTNIVASADENPDLFWALRGAGKNFAILTSAEFALFPLEKVLNAKVFIPLAQARASLRVVQDILDEAGDNLSTFSAFTAVPNQGFGLVLEPLWSGRKQRGEHYLGLLSRLEGATVLVKSWVVYRDIYDASSDAAWPDGQGYRMDAHNIARLTPEVIDVTVECARRSPSEKNCIMLHDFRGAAARVPTEATAFPFRFNHFNMQIVARWEPGRSDEEAKGRQWIEHIRAVLNPLSTRGGYPSVLGLDSHDRARAFYGEAIEALTVIKRKYDLENRFSADFGLF